MMNAATQPHTALSYRPQLDTVRTFAVGAVMLQHLVGLANLPGIMKTLPWGHLGVTLFFVLSGFLITGILIRSRDAVEASTQTVGFAARQFYARRFLRIFPLYYFIIAVGLVLAIPPVREIWVWLVSYTMNILVSLKGDENFLYSNFWSLAVEEQFYVMWPWIVLFAPRKWLLPITIAMISCGPLWRAYAFTQGVNAVALYKLTPACLDSLGVGALLAQAHRSRLTINTISRVTNGLALPVGVFVSLCLWALVYFEINWSANIVLFDLSIALIFCWFINSASIGFGGTAGRVMEWRPLVYCGKISYGMYVYHQFAPPIFSLAFAKFGITYDQHGWLNFFLGSALTILISSASWYLLEQPFNNLKRHFDYQTKRRKHAGEAIVEPKMATSESTPSL
jgi:peptidoglycan/LPS O-acetylase OafA/YrhL